MKTIKVLRIINRFNLGGITYNVSYLSRYMDKSFETVLAGGPEEEGEASSLFIPKGLGLEPIVIQEMQKSPDIFQDLRAYRRIKRLIKKHRPHIVHTHASKAGFVGRLAAWRCGVPVIVHTFHGHVFSGYFGRAKTALVKITERFLSRISHAVVAISDKQKEELTKKYRVCSPSKVHVIPLGFDLGKFTENRAEKRQRFRDDYGFSDEGLVLGIIGRLVPIKDHVLFVKAVAACKKNTGRKVRAVIVGDGETRSSIEKAIRDHGCSFTKIPGEQADFVFAGWIRDVDTVLPGLDLVCLTSKNEGTPVSLIEAQACGKFIVSTNVGGISDILHPGCGLLSDAGNDSAYISNLCEAVKNFESYSKIAGEASAEIQNRFSYQRLCADMENLYRALLKNRTKD